MTREATEELPGLTQAKHLWPREVPGAIVQMVVQAAMNQMPLAMSDIPEGPVVAEQEVVRHLTVVPEEVADHQQGMGSLQMDNQVPVIQAVPADRVKQPEVPEGEGGSQEQMVVFPVLVEEVMEIAPQREMVLMVELL